jgi:aryl-alcohol dehydrogenase-like predicted oxidoreductase
MGMSEFYGPGDEAESLATLDRAFELGVTFLDTADMYGPFKNEELVGTRDPRPSRPVFLATKFGICATRRAGWSAASAAAGIRPKRV